MFLITWISGYYVFYDLPKNYAQIVTGQALWVQISCLFQFDLMLLGFSAAV
jgi:hypothetical protein